METRFIVDDIQYYHPDTMLGHYAVYVRPMFQLIDDDGRLLPMVVNKNKPKSGLMDSEIDEEFLEEYWGLRNGY